MRVNEIHAGRQAPSPPHPPSRPSSFLRRRLRPRVVVSVEVGSRLFVLGLCALLSLALVAAASTARVQKGPRTPEAIRPCKSRGDGNKPQRLPSPVGARLGPLVIWPSIRSQVQAFGS